MKITFFIKEILLILVILSEYNLYITRIIEIDNFLTIIFYVILFVLLVTIIYLTANIKNNFIRLIFGIVFSISFVFYDAFYRITSEFLTYSTFVSLISANAFISDAFIQYSESILTSITIGIVLFAGFSLKPRLSERIHKIIPITAPIVGIILLTGLFYMRGGDGGKGLPAMYIPIAYSNLYVYELMTSYKGERKQINIPHNKKTVNHDIILIIDESVRGDYLDINSEYGVNSGLMYKYDDIDIFNYGLAASITNCSNETNVTLRYGGTRNNYQLIINSMPSLWQYAKNVGMHTIYIDSQRTNGQLQNGMNELELKNIDNFIQFDDTQVLYRDIEAAKKLVEFINNDQQEFIIVNKIGAHFPVHDKYPDDYMKYKPVLPRGKFLNISDTGSREGFEGNDSWELYRNSYRNTLLWSVGHFFSIILEEAKLKNTVIIYTSDHGQDLHERKNPGLQTHCSGEPNIEEGIVPLVVITGKDSKTVDWEKNLEINHNNVSQYQIFPTLLKLMNYDDYRVKEMYGIPLTEIVNDPYTFNTRFHAKFGKKPKWEKIIIDKIAKPTESIEKITTAETEKLIHSR